VDFFWTSPYDQTRQGPNPLFSMVVCSSPLSLRFLGAYFRTQRAVPFFFATCPFQSVLPGAVFWYFLCRSSMVYGVQHSELLFIPFQTPLSSLVRPLIVHLDPHQVTNILFSSSSYNNNTMPYILLFLFAS